MMYRENFSRKAGISGKKKYFSRILYVVTADPGKVAARYPASVSENIFKLTSLPSMPDDRGHLLLLNRQMDLIDEVLYNEEMHYSLLSEHEGYHLRKSDLIYRLMKA